ncbi:protease modulator HflC [Acuticoccus yangtzensis]|uniref:protease modulator HflC n=1 Tax=Acuticoccus yangtzensis TaxID=1443441 RepID=UPI000949839A|nr:protease modulator HflC [Acuticoccus yangtzensis]
MRAGLIALIVIVVAAVFAALNSLFIINPMQQALVLQFGQVKNTVREPGLNVKIPFIQDVLILDRRILDLNVPAQEIIAADQKRLVVDAFMRYRIRNPVEFYQTVNNVAEGAQRLNTFVQASLRAVLADATFTAIVRDNRPELMQRISDDVAARAQAIGVEVVDVKIRRADLPEANSAAIFRRMQTEREQEAREIRAQGAEAARRIEAAADRTATVLRAEARRQSEQIRGEGDARKSAIFAAAYMLDPGFFDFYRSMQAYEQGLRSQDTRLVLSPDSDFFRYFGDPRGAVRRAAPATGEGVTGEAGTGTGGGESGGEARSSFLSTPPSGADPSEVRREIEDLAGAVTPVAPVVVPPLEVEGLASDTAGGDTADAATSDTAAPATSTAAPATATAAPAIDLGGTAPAPIPQEDIPAMSAPEDEAATEAATDTAPAPAVDAPAAEDEAADAEAPGTADESTTQE